MQVRPCPKSRIPPTAETVSKPEFLFVFLFVLVRVSSWIVRHAATGTIGDLLRLSFENGDKLVGAHITRVFGVPSQNS